MRRRAAAAGGALAIVLMACGAAPVGEEATAGHSSRTAPAPAPAPTPAPTGPPAPGATSPSDADALATGIRMLRGAGVTEVGQAEPPHGSPIAIVSGTCARALVVATVRPGDDPVGPPRLVGTPPTRVRLGYGGHRVDLSVLDDSGAFLPEVSLELAAAVRAGGGGSAGGC